MKLHVITGLLLAMAAGFFGGRVIELTAALVGLSSIDGVRWLAFAAAPFAYIGYAIAIIRSGRPRRCCPTCSVAISAAARFCPRCGHALSRDRSVAAQKCRSL
jgi:hypothetical protein